MPTQVHIGVEGAAELARSLRKAGNTGLLDALKVANENAAEIVVDEALPDIPRRSGALRNSTRARSTARAGSAVAGGLKGVAYAAAIHWGRGRGNVGSPPGNRMGRNPIRGRPFLWDAAQRAVPRVEPEYRDEVMRIMDAAVRSAT
jgi:hypothetical protein